jgi:pectate lyase
MKFEKFLTTACIIFNLILNNTLSFSQNHTLAFPGADGFAKFISGGRGGQVRKVTNLNDSGPGSFREAASFKDPSIIVFEVSGTIELKSNVTLQNNTTIAGHSAPGDGITFKNYRLTLINKNNIIIRYIRFRLGDLTGREDNPIFVRDCTDIIFDHCSMSWGTDETATNFRNRNVTFQWCLFSEGLHNSVHSKGPHGYGAVFGGKNVSYHHNLFAHFSHRTPMFDHPDLYKTKDHFDNFRGVVDFRNNVVYNWMDRAANGGVEGTINFINNYYKPGPATNKYHRNFFLNPTKMGNYNYGKFYVKGNFLEGNSKVSSDNWIGVRLENPELTEKYLESIKVQSPFPAEVYDATDSAMDAYIKILQHVGASLSRDSVDIRIINETKKGIYTHEGSKGSNNGIIDSQNDVGGWPDLRTTLPPKDTDNDGIPDTWEIQNGLNPNKRDDRWYHLDRNYTNVEIYLNSLVNQQIDPKY